MQSKVESLVEACVNTLIGMTLAFALNIFLLSANGIVATPAQNLSLVLGHTVLSVVRSYVLRRFFTRKLWKPK